MVTHRFNQGTWTTYRLEDWDKKLQQQGDIPSIFSISAAPNGGLWFATIGGTVSSGEGAFYFDGKTWTHYTKENGLVTHEIATSTAVPGTDGGRRDANEIYTSAVAPDGAVWFGTLCCGVTRFDGKSWTTYTTDNGLASNTITSILFAPDGALWFGTNAGVSRYDGKGWQTYNDQNGMPGNTVGPMLALPDSSLLVAFSDHRSAKVMRFDGQHWSNFPVPWPDVNRFPYAMVMAPNGDLWFGTEVSGVYRLSGTTWTHYTTKDGLASDLLIRSIAIAKDGAVWVGTVNGLSQFDGQRWTTFTLDDDGGSHTIGPILIAADGSVWLGYFAGIAHYVPDRSH
jgi:ligand-binding sensor domain-containing protein